MLEVIESNKFKRSFKKIKQNKSFKLEKFDYAIFMLASNIMLPKNYKDHELSGKMKGKRECHISPDILLIYKIEDEFIYLELLDIGTHSNLFK
jgi:mRNA interferase YafQ